MSLATRGSHWWGIIGALLVALALGGCSAVKLGYNTLPDVGYWWLDGYLDFTADQAPRVKERLQRLQAWHRATELPKVADMLGRMEALANASFAPAQACAFADEIRTLFAATLQQAEPAAADMASTLTAHQLRHLQRKYADNNRRWRTEWIEMPTQERLDKRYKQWLERLEMVYGGLGEQQRSALHFAIAQTAFDPQLVLAERQRRQQDLLHTLRRISAQPSSAADARSLLDAYLQRALHSPNPEYRTYQQASIEEGCRIIAAVHDSATPEQRAQAARRLRAYQRDVMELRAQP